MSTLILLSDTNAEAQAKVNAAGEGALVEYEPGIHPLRSTTPLPWQRHRGALKGLTVFDGSVEITGPWTVEGSNWWAPIPGGIVDKGLATNALYGDVAAQLPEELFRNGVRDRRVSTLAEAPAAAAPTETYRAGKWWLDYANARVYVGTNPGTATFRLSLSQFALVGIDSPVTCQRLTVRKYATGMRRGPLGGGFGFDFSTVPREWTWEDCTVDDCHGSGFVGALGGTLRRVRSRRNGHTGALMSGAANQADTGDGLRGSGDLASILVEDSLFYENGQNRHDYMWEGGGLKVTLVTDPESCTVRNNLFGRNRVHGLWFDVYCETVDCYSNHAVRNSRVGIMHELTRGPGEVRDNLCEHNAGTGSQVDMDGNPITDNPRAELWIGKSRDLEVWRNIFRISAGLGIYGQSRDVDYLPYLGNVDVHDNHWELVGDPEGFQSWEGIRTGTDPYGSDNSRLALVDSDGNQYWNLDGAWMPFRYGHWQADNKFFYELPEWQVLRGQSSSSFAWPGIPDRPWDAERWDVKPYTGKVDIQATGGRMWPAAWGWYHVRATAKINDFGNGEINGRFTVGNGDTFYHLVHFRHSDTWLDQEDAPHPQYAYSLEFNSDGGGTVRLRKSKNYGDEQYASMLLPMGNATEVHFRISADELKFKAKVWTGANPEPTTGPANDGWQLVGEDLDEPNARYSGPISLALQSAADGTRALVTWHELNVLPISLDGSPLDPSSVMRTDAFVEPAGFVAYDPSPPPSPPPSGTAWRFGVELVSPETREALNQTLDVESMSTNWAYRAVDPTHSVEVADSTPRRTGQLRVRHDPEFNPLSVWYRPWIEEHTDEVIYPTAVGDPTFTRASTAYLDGIERAAGVPRTKDGGVLIEEGTTNLFTANQASGGEGGTITGFSGRGSGTTLVSTTEQSWQGARSIKVGTGGTNGAMYGADFLPYITITTGTTYTLSLWVYSETAGEIIHASIAWRRPDNTIALIAPYDETTARGWTRLSITSTAPADVDRAQCFVQRPGLNTIPTFYIDGGQFEAKAYATSWHPGAATRSGERLYAPLGLVNAEGTLELDVDLPVPSAHPTNARLFDGGGTTGSLFRAYRQANGNLQVNVGSLGLNAGMDIAAAGRHRVAVTWNTAGNVAVYIGGTKTAEAAFSGSLPTAIVNLGQRSSLEQINGRIEGARFSSRARSDVELGDWEAPLVSDEDTTFLLQIGDDSLDAVAGNPEYRWNRGILGTFFAARMPGVDHDGTTTTRTIPLAEVSARFAEQRLAAPLEIEPGTPLAQWLRDDLQSRFREPDVSGISDVNKKLLGDNATWDHDHMSFDVDTLVIDMYDRVLSYLGYEPLRVDRDTGRPIAQPARDFATEPVGHKFGGTGAGISPEITVDPITPDIPNQVIFRARNAPSLMDEGEGQRTVRNENTGPGSIQQRGRVISETVVVDADDQAELDAIALYRAPLLFAGGGWTLDATARATLGLDDSDVIEVEHSIGTSGRWLVVNYGFAATAGKESTIVDMKLGAELLAGAAFTADAFVTPPAVATVGVAYRGVAS